MRPHGGGTRAGAPRLAAWLAGLRVRYQVALGLAVGVALVTLAFGLIAAYMLQQNINVSKEERRRQTVALAASLDTLAHQPGSGAERLAETLSLLGLAGLHATVIDSRGNVLAASSPEALASVGPRLELLSDLISGRRAGVMIQHLRGSSHIVAFAPMQSVAGGVVVATEENPALLAQLLLLRVLPFFGLGVMVLASLGAWLHARWVVRPLSRLERAAATIAQGKLDEPITTARQDEIGRLARSFEAMRRQLGAAGEAQAQWQAELEQRVRERTAEVQRLVQRVISAQEEERRRLAQELHDDTAQALATVLMGLETLRDSLPPGQERVRQHVERTIAEGGRALEDLRRVILGLRPAAVDNLGVVAALRSYAGARLAPSGVRLDFTVQGQERRLPEAVEAGLFRILQEAVNNIAKHARAQNARVRLDFGDTQLEATVEDDGQGFDTTRAPAAGQGLRLGLEGMQERADVINARLEVTSVPGKGTRVRVVLPGEETGHDHG